jgi:uncharacterized protein
MTVLKVVLAAGVLIYLVAAAGMFVLQRQFQYFPSRQNPAPAAVGLAGVTAEALATPDGETLVLWYAPAAAGQPTILYFHGNGGEIADRADRLAAYRTAGFGVAFLSWRGYGGSTGQPTEGGLLTDARTAYDWLIARGIPPEKIALVGESLGTGFAVQLAAERPVGAVVLGAPYAAAVDIAADLYPWLPVRLLMKDQLRSIDHIGAVTAPLLILHGTTDRVIPFPQGQALFAAANDPKTFTALSGAGHEALYDPAIWALEIAFLHSIFAP